MTKQYWGHNELAAWADAGLDLPAPLTELLDARRRVADEVAAITRPADRPAEPAELVAAGSTIDDALAQAGKAAVAANLAADRIDTGTRAERLIVSTAAAWVAEHRDELIAAVLRPAVNDLVDLAAGLHGKAPASGEDAARDATPSQLKAWRAVDDADRRFQTLLDVWLTSWHTATTGPPGTRTDPALRPDTPGGLHAWRDPDAVSDPNVRDGHDRRLASVAAHHRHGGYQLLAPSELAEVVDGIVTRRPWIEGERHARGVLLVDREATEALRDPQVPGRRFAVRFL